MEQRIAMVCMMASLAFSTVLADGMATEAAGRQQIRIRMGDRVVTATLNGSPAARDFGTLLPLSLHMSDWLSREKVARLPWELSVQSKGIPSYEAGDLGYWRPSNNFVIYYLQDGSSLPPPGIVPLGKIDGAFDIFDVPGEIDVTVEPAG